MTRPLIAVAAIALVLVGLPVAAALAFALLTPAVVAATLAGDTDQTQTQTQQNDLDGIPVPVAGERGQVLQWARTHVGQPYRMGAAGPDAWDCSSFTQAAYRQVGVQLPRTAQAQRDWLAAGHGKPVPPGHEQPADLIFWDSYLGPDTIGHVVLVDDPNRHRTVEAHNTSAGTGYFTYQPGHNRYEIWRPHVPNPVDAPAGTSALTTSPTGAAG